MPTPQEFIEDWPLYTHAEILDFESPDAISRNCEGECEKETTWSRVKDVGVSCLRSSLDFQAVSYICNLCGKASLIVLYRRIDWHRRPELGPAPLGKMHWNVHTRAIAGVGYYSANEWQHGAVQKIGQIPAPSIDVDSQLQKLLGSAAFYYKEGLLCRTHNLGVGAVAYMRRVIEDKTDELIDVVVELAKTYSVEANVIKALADAKTQIQYEEKLRVASDAIPDALKPGGVNPLGQLYKHLSIGVHGKRDRRGMHRRMQISNSSIIHFDDLKEDFEFVFRNLKIEGAERAKFVERVKGRRISKKL